MWRVPELEKLLPPGFFAMEDIDLVVVECQYCLHENRYSGQAAEVKQLLTDAVAHRRGCRTPDESFTPLADRLPAGP